MGKDEVEGETGVVTVSLVAVVYAGVAEAVGGRVSGSSLVWRLAGGPGDDGVE